MTQLITVTKYVGPSHLNEARFDDELHTALLNPITAVVLGPAETYEACRTRFVPHADAPTVDVSSKADNPVRPFHTQMRHEPTNSA